MSARYIFVFMVSKMFDLGQNMKKWIFYSLDTNVVMVPVLTIQGQHCQSNQVTIFYRQLLQSANRFMMHMER